VMDCGAAGLVCSDGACADAALDSCESQTCEGAAVVDCAAGFAARWDCTTIEPGFVCWDDAGQLRCGFPPETHDCAPPLADEPDGSCSGTLAVICVEGRRVAIDCASTGAACGIVGTQVRCTTP
jgi:hypothetical protein